MKGKESGEEREEEEELANRECEAREKGIGEKMRARGSKPWPVGLLQARSPGPAPAYGRSRRQNGGRDMGIQVGNAAETDEQQNAG